MAVPWLKLIDVALGLTDVARRARARTAEPSPTAPAIAPGALGGIEARLAGVVVAALKEAFDRDHQRLELERSHIEAERQRAERALRLEMLRQAGEREIARMRLVSGVALASWLGSLVLATRLLDGVAGRVTLGLGWLCLLLALSAAFMEQGRLTRELARVDERTPVDALALSGTAGLVAPWLVIAGLALSALGMLLS